MRLGGEPFRVVGVLEKLPRSMAEGAGPSGNYAIIPLTTDRQRFGEYSIDSGKGAWQAERVQVSQVILQMDSDDSVVGGAEIAKSLMQRYHEADDYEITVPLELIRQKAQQRRLWNIMFLAIASVSLIVGGIGIMSNMLASVTERTREIGVRRAMGAKRSDIVAQFLIEAVALTMAGGLLGILLGLAIPQAIEKALQIPAIISPWTLVLPFAMAVIVGLASGLYPAWQASRLDPIEALRHE